MWPMPAPGPADGAPHPHCWRATPQQTKSVSHSTPAPHKAFHGLSPAAGFVFRPYAAKPIAVRGCQGCAERTTGAERKEPGLDAGAHGDYLAWPSKDGKPQRPEAGQGSGSRAAPTREASPAMGCLPRRPDPRHTARPVKDRSTYPGSAATHEGRGGTLPPHCWPAHASTAACLARHIPFVGGQNAVAVVLVRAARPGLDAGALRHYIPNACTEGGKPAEDPWQERHSR
jgi:hypothetical protein